jgi:putative ABC transport system substrate-binding protein
MSNPAVPPEWEATQAASRVLGLQAELLDVRSETDLDRALEHGVQRELGGLIVGADGLTQMHRQRIVDFAARARLPAVYPGREFVEIGGLVAYAVNYPELYLRLASFVDKIFKGSKPGELPVEQPAKFELVINSKTAKGLGIIIPATLLFDEIVE